ncbi:hypothetical protein ACJX0J_017684, partial [Zea mays]
KEGLWARIEKSFEKHLLFSRLVGVNVRSSTLLTFNMMKGGGGGGGGGASELASFNQFTPFLKKYKTKDLGGGGGGLLAV